MASNNRKRKREFGPQDVDKNSLYRGKKAAWAHYFQEQREHLKDIDSLRKLKQHLKVAEQQIWSDLGGTRGDYDILDRLPIHLVQRMTECEKLFECPVCAEELDLCNEDARKQLKMTTCGHFFCAKCLEGLPEPQRCPQCRTSIKVRI